MRALFFLILILPSVRAAHFPRLDQFTTDQRIAACQKAIAATPADPSALEDLAAAYLQKMRETTDFGYVERAEKLVAQALVRKPGDFEALILTNEIELNRHHFAQVLSNTGRLVKTAPEDARLRLPLARTFGGA